jgi:membrane protease YdiL (CAAX protease family)
MLANTLISSLLNVLLFAALPFLFYAAYHVLRHGRGLAEIAGRAGARPGEARYIWYCLAVAMVAGGVLAVWPPPLAPFMREGSPQRQFVGLGLSRGAVLMALLYGAVKTGFAEEFLFRGLITGSLSRRLSASWANLLQSVIFILPHLLLLRMMPELWGIIPVIFFGSLFAGWARIKSGSILGPWLIHASVNVAMCLSVAARTGT